MGLLGSSLIITTLFSEVTLNSTSSVLSYNHFDFGPLFSGEDKVRKEKKEQEKHQSTFFRQMVYFLLFTILNLGSVISSTHHV